MAITQAMCTSFKDQILEAVHDFRVGGDTFKLALYTSAAATLDSTTPLYSTNPGGGAATEVANSGTYSAGGGALLRGLDALLAQQTKMPVHIAADPLTSVARGTGMVLEDLDSLKDVLVSTQYEKAPY